MTRVLLHSSLVLVRRQRRSHQKRPEFRREPTLIASTQAIRRVSLSLFVLLIPSAVLAQTPQAPQPPLVLERIFSPWVAAPDYKIADVDGDTGQLAGAYVGRLVDNTLFIGGGFYWLVNGDRGEEMRYGGLLLGWSMPAGRIIRFGGRGLVGFGTATLGTDVAFGRDIGVRDRGRPLPPQPFRYLASDDFFVFEPQLNATVQVIPHVGVEFGGGYRVTGATDALEHRLNGVSGSVAAQLTW